MSAIRLLARRLAVVLALAVSMAARPALALDTGDAPPALPGGIEWLGGARPLDWDEARGSVVVLAFIDPDDGGRSKGALEAFVVLAKDRGKDGLRVAAIAETERSKLEALARAVGALGVAGVSLGVDPERAASRAYLVTSCPKAYVVGRDGTVTWCGEPVQARIGFQLAVAEALRDPRRVGRRTGSPVLVKACAAIDREDWKAAIAELRSILARKETAPSDRADAEALLAEIAGRAADARRQAAALAAEGDFAGAAAILEDVIIRFEGLDAADEAEKQLEAWRKDKKIGKEIEAGALLLEAQGLEEQGKTKEALALYKRIASKYKETAAAARAEERVRELAPKDKTRTTG